MQTDSQTETAQPGSLHPAGSTILSKSDFMAADEVYQRACARKDAAYAALGSGDRWGETRRFSGARAGNRLARIERANAAWSKAYDAAEKRWMRYSSNVCMSEGADKR